MSINNVAPAVKLLRAGKGEKNISDAAAIEYVAGNESDVSRWVALGSTAAKVAVHTINPAGWTCGCRWNGWKTMMGGRGFTAGEMYEWIK